MSTSFLTEDFLLESKAAIRLYHDFAKNQPIIDYHCHLPPDQVARDHSFSNLTEIWLSGDHYKWRAMRANGVNEKFITGAASDWEKFLAWARTVPYTLRNPLYHWTHLELKRPFGINDKLLNEDTAKGIWEECNEMLAQKAFSCRGIMKQMNVVLVATTDDPIDSLEHHETVAQDEEFDIQMLPAFRPDKGLAVEIPHRFNTWVNKLGEAAQIDIASFRDYLDAFENRINYFHEHGCRLSDHGLEAAYAEDYDQETIRTIFARARAGKEPTPREGLQFRSALLLELCKMYHAKGWTQQFHLGALRNNNSRMFENLGPDTGFDSMGDFPQALPISRLMNRLDATNQLAKTILYNNNPVDNEVLATMCGNFQGGGIPGKIQFGSGWWFLDQLDGMTKQVNALSNMGLLSRFVGMLTDSRSFLSYTRHEYFRRLLCNLLGDEMERGLIPTDFSLVGGMVKDICYNNAAEYFGFDLPKQA